MTRFSQDFPFDLRKGDKREGCDSEGGAIFETEEEEWTEIDRWRDMGDDGRWYCDCPAGGGEEIIANVRQADEDDCPVCGAHKEDEQVTDYEESGWVCRCGETNTVLDDRCSRCGAESPWGADDLGDLEGYEDQVDTFWRSREDELDDIEDYIDHDDL